MYKFFLFFFALSMVTMAQVSPDSTTTTGRIITYEEFKKNQEKEQQITTVTDSIKPTIEVVTDTTSMVNIPVITIATAAINEYPEVDKFDENLLKELYNNDMYDYMYDEVIQMDYSEAVMKTLPTDTLKARLKRINETTPFQIDYNPVLEQLINKKLSHQRIYMERLMTLSDYYFPLFEEMLDKYDIPLEMKY
ncbi:MAG: lytic transglycosylase, partial [Nonlabens ulvanivorans]